MSDFEADENFKELAPVANIGHHEKMTLDLFVELMKQFYDLCWMRGTGGAMGCLANNELFVSPSALQKERLTAKDIFVFNLEDHKLSQHAANPKITVSSCACLFTMLMKSTGATCVIHTHSKSANLITQLIKDEVFEISHQEYIKGIWDPFTNKNFGYEDTLTIPIIDNRPSESMLLPGLEATLAQNARCCAVLVRKHGLFVWGPTWEQTKVMTECIDYLLELAIEMKKMGLQLVHEEASGEKTTSDSCYNSVYLN